MGPALVLIGIVLVFVAPPLFGVRHYRASQAPNPLRTKDALRHGVLLGWTLALGFIGAGILITQLA